MRFPLSTTKNLCNKKGRVLINVVGNKTYIQEQNMQRFIVPPNTVQTGKLPDI